MSDINSFEYFEEMTKDWNRADLLRRCYDLCNEIVEKSQEIERLNNIIKEVREYIEKMEKLHFDYSYEKQELLEILERENK